MGWLTDGDSGKYYIRGRYTVIVADKVYSGGKGQLACSRSWFLGQVAEKDGGAYLYSMACIKES
jgi:hypothetical protein